MADQNVATSAETESPEKLRQQLVELQQQYTKVTQQLAHYQRIAELAPSVLYIYDLVGQQNIYANHELTDLLGYSVEEVQRMGEALFVTLLHPDDLSIIIEHHQRLAGAADNEILELRYRMRHANGDWHWLASREVVFARDAAGTPIQKLGAVYDITTQVQHESDLLMFKAVVENAPEGIGVSDLVGTQVYANAAFLQLIKQGTDFIGKPYTAYIDEVNPEVINALMTHGVWQGVSEYKRGDGMRFNGHSTNFLIRDNNGEPRWMAGVLRDITEQQKAEQERTALQEQLINAQQAALRELSTPLIPLADGLVVMPLIGAIDSGRAQQVLEELLSGVAEHHAQTAILDITGVSVVDTQVAGALLRAAQAVKLLGAQVIITGIGPEIAQTLVGLGLDLQGIITRGSLQSGIAYALKSNPVSKSSL